MSLEASMPQTPAQRYGTLLWRFVGSRQWDRALEVSKDWLAEDPDNGRAQQAFGQALVNLKRYAEARKPLERALSLEPRNGFTHRLLSIISFHQNRQAEADDHMQQAIELEPLDATHWYHLAWMRYRQNAYEAATRHARRALELDPSDADTLNLLAICERDNPQAQLERYQRALELDPESSAVHNNLGTYYLNHGKDDARAEALFRRALTLDPTDDTAQKNLFLVLRRRDPLYRVLASPRGLVNLFSVRGKGYGSLQRLALLFLWILLGRFIFVAIVGWLGLIFPLTKVYEQLTLGDIKAKAGILGARRGGWWGFRKWPFFVRFGLFVLIAVTFWGSLWLAFVNDWLRSAWLAGIIGLVILAWSGWWLGRWLKRWRIRAQVRRGERKFHGGTPTTARSPLPRPSWQAAEEDLY